MSNITVYKFLKKISTNLQTVAEKTAKNFGGYFFFAAPCMFERIRGSYDDTLCKSMCTLLTLL